MQIDWTPALTDLGRLLAQLFDDPADPSRIVDDAGLNRGRINLYGKPFNVWHKIVREAHISGKIPKLLNVVKHEFPSIDFNSLELLLTQNTRVEGPEPADWRAIPGEEQTFEQIMGSQPTFLPISFLEKGLARARSVVRIEYRSADGERPIATGFLALDNLLVTNNHVIPTVEKAAAMQVRFNYQKDPEGADVTGAVYLIDPADCFETCTEDDWTAVAIAGTPGDHWPSLELKGCAVGADEFVNIIQHPAGLHKQIALYHNVVKYADKHRVQYLTDTLRGSSGSPVFNSNWDLVALHHSGGFILEPGTTKRYFRNEGISIYALLRGLSEKGVLS